ncbi:MAG: Crp/Fnr family transcriptional regulator [Cyclobacteriaceae bacterium]
MLSDLINEIYPIPESAIKAIEHLARIKHFQKNDHFIAKGAHNKEEYFVLEGVIRSFVLNPQGEEVTIAFYCANSVIAPHVARNRSGRSQLSFQALTESKLAVLDSQEFETLRSENKEVRNFAFTVLQNELLRKVSKEIGLASLTASERLKIFRKEYRNLENMVPHPFIASYLGITNISLSRLRSEIRD